MSPNRRTNSLPLALPFLVWHLASPIAPSVEPPVDPYKPIRNYYAYVCAESEDEVALVRFGPSGLDLLKRIPVGSFPAEIEGPHGITVSPDGRHWYVSIAHGRPFGSVHRYTTGSDEWLGTVTVGMFPATLTVSPTTGLLYVVNFDLHGAMKPSSISVVETSTMTEVARVATGIMPHGSRLNRRGDRHYSVNMMGDELVEVDALRFEIVRRLPLPPHGGAKSRAKAHRRRETDKGDPTTDLVQPTWVTAPTDAGKIYIAGFNKDLIFEVDVNRWTISRTFSRTGGGPYNLAVTPDERTLVVTYKRGNAVGFWDLVTGQELARVPTTRRVPHGVVITPDGRYSLVSVEGVGGQAGVVEVYDIPRQQRVDHVELGKQAGGIALWSRGP